MRHTSGKLRATILHPIGLKYCGGCTPEYNRTNLAEHLRQRLTGIAELVPWHSADTDLVLVIAGCKTACVDLGPFDKKQVLILTCPKDADPLVNQIIKHIKKGAYK